MFDELFKAIALTIAYQDHVRRTNGPALTWALQGTYHDPSHGPRPKSKVDANYARSRAVWASSTRLDRHGYPYDANGTSYRMI